MTLRQAIDIRISRRTYNNKPLNEKQVETLQDSIKAMNSKYNLNIQLVIGNGDAFSKLSKSYGMFSGVQNYIALIGKSKDENLMERIGSAGEEIVLAATCIGLGTCWVGGTFDKKSCKCELNDDESIVCVIPVGETPNNQTLKEKLIRKAAHHSTKKIDEMITSDIPLPEWITECMEAVQKAPSAINKQPVKFVYQNGILTASVDNPNTYQGIDLGIAKYHFSCAAYIGEFELGNGAAFKLH